MNHESSASGSGELLEVETTSLFTASVPILGVYISDIDNTVVGNISYRLELA